MLKSPEPEDLNRLLSRGLLVLAAALLGFGLLLWVAANWEQIGRAGRFALLQGLLAASAAGAALLPTLRAPLALLAFVATGGLFAFFGQTYQTGADAWQLFALWAALGLPLALAARSDVVWLPWTLVASTAVALFVELRTGWGWRAQARDLPAHLLGLALLLVLNAALVPGLARWTGAGVWARRCMAVATLLPMLAIGCIALFSLRVGPQYAVALALLGALAWLLSTPRGFDLFLLSAVAFGLDVLLLCGLARGLFSGGGHHEPIGETLLLGLAGAGLLALSVQRIMALGRRRARVGGPA